ncbi:alpha/beta hydrolase family protein [Planctomycetota bacterium]
MRISSLLIKIVLLVIVLHFSIQKCYAKLEWKELHKIVTSFQNEKNGGEQVLDALELRAQTVLKSIRHPTDLSSLDSDISHLKDKLAASLGLERLPKPQARNAKVVGVVDRETYQLEKIIYETFSGTKVPAHLYLPKSIENKLPAVLFVPGHWWKDSKSRINFQKFCINMARMGFAVLTYDPVGQGERGVSRRDHRRTETLLMGIGQEGITVFESLCALDYMLSREEIDPDRIGITGASGGGYNSWMMSALDSRFSVCVPVVGTSEFYEQLHVCRPLDWYQANEHCHFVPGLIQYANNHELLAMVAPKPLLIISAHNDQSFPLPGIRDVVDYGQELYKEINHPNCIAYFEDDSEGHGYQKKKREAAYGWFAHWLKHEGDANPIREPNTDTPEFDDPLLCCFTQEKKCPAGPGIIAQVKEWLEKLPVQISHIEKKELCQTLIKTLSVRISSKTVRLQRTKKSIKGSIQVERIQWKSFDNVDIPAVLLSPIGQCTGVLLAIGDRGKETLLHRTVVRAALEHQLAVVLADVRGMGELTVQHPGWAFAVSLLLKENFVGLQALDLIAGQRALAEIPEFHDKPIGVYGAGQHAALAALYAAVLHHDFQWLICEDGFISYRSFVNREKSMPLSYKLSPPDGKSTWSGDREIPPDLFVFDALSKFDLPDLFGSVLPKPVLIINPIDGDYETMSEKESRIVLSTSRYIWESLPVIAIDFGVEHQLQDFFRNLNSLIRPIR